MTSLHLTSQDDDTSTVNWRTNTGLLHALATRLHGEAPWIHSHDWSDGVFRISCSGTYRGEILPDEQATLSVPLDSIELVPISDYEYQVWGVVTGPVSSSKLDDFSVLPENRARRHLLFHASRQCPMLVPDGKGNESSYQYQSSVPTPIPDDPNGIALLPFVLGQNVWIQRKAHRPCRLSPRWSLKRPRVRVIHAGDDYLHAAVVARSFRDPYWPDAPKQHDYHLPVVIPMLIRHVEYIGQQFPKEVRLYGLTGSEQKPRLLLALKRSEPCRFSEEYPDLMKRFLLRP